MPFSHHSHSGQFCGHATNSLAEIVEHAVNQRKMCVFGLTEHCPRGGDDLYPEEHKVHSASSLQDLYDAFIAEASRLQTRYRLAANELDGPQCELLIGFETEWIRPAESKAIVQRLLECHKDTIDYFVGSVHHVRTIPIDFDKALYNDAKMACGGSDDALYLEYFDAQLEMLQAFRPRIVGHFDLIRLFSDAPDADLQTAGGGKVWSSIVRNLQCAKKMGALLEINSSAFRKGLAQPYPRLEICRAWLELGGQFVLSDDSHGIAQVGTNYSRVLSFLDELAPEGLAYLSKSAIGGAVEIKMMPMSEVRAHVFWKTT